MSHTEQDWFATFMVGFGLHFHLRKSNNRHKTASGQERWVEMTSKWALKKLWMAKSSLSSTKASKQNACGPYMISFSPMLKLLHWYCRLELYEIEHYFTDICPRASDYSLADCKTLLWPACGWMAWEASITKIINGPEGWILKPQEAPVWHNWSIYLCQPWFSYPEAPLSSLIIRMTNAKYWG